MPVKLISPKQQMRAAQSFPFFSSIAILIPVLIPIWIAASIFVYAAVAHHPNDKVCAYLVPAGYRFYGVLGAWVVVLNFSSHLANMVGGALNLALLLWAISILVVVPLGVRDVLRAQRANWCEIEHQAE
ncbi:hypothetical protein ED236_06030 [Pseudomethylobacillus aquaticus]|uniref:DUF4870 domain-containing protein n=1 Tax=Pseudomethylobacillus aquaticus TaxID=2676064 RepID=A0A3N0V3E3_9PROT|nr:hypothetical protein [Pseudomethylobacillus aquaticus]ROH87225.1 hypothetical protein ED236_06030 [Pseudomethylobacillus aquaticus]